MSGLGGQKKKKKKDDLGQGTLVDCQHDGAVKGPVIHHDCTVGQPTYFVILPKQLDRERSGVGDRKGRILCHVGELLCSA